jgi:hypothetical protein
VGGEATARCKTPCDLQLPKAESETRVTLRLDGYKDKARSVKPNRDAALEFALEKEPEPDPDKDPDVPPDKDVALNNGNGDGNGNGGNGLPDGPPIVRAGPAEHVKPILIHADAGLSRVGFGEELGSFSEPSIGLGGGYAVLKGSLTVFAGARFGYIPVPYSNGGNASLISLAATGEGRYRITPKIGVSLGLALGPTWFAGLKMGNPFTNDGTAATGPLGMFAARFALGVDYKLTPAIAVRVTPFAFTFSPAPKGMDEQEIDSINRMEFLVGVGYSL